MSYVSIPRKNELPPGFGIKIGFMLIL